MDKFPMTKRGFSALEAELKTLKSKERPEIIQCYSMSGETDYILHIVVRDVASYEYFLMHHLLRQPIVDAVNSSFALRQIKYTTALPLPPET